MLVVPNHHAIVPITKDVGVAAIFNTSATKHTIFVDLFGDSILCGRDPDLIDPECGCSYQDLEGAVPQPPSRLLEIFLPQYILNIRSRCSGLSTSSQLLNGTDNINKVWPTDATGNIIVINHGLNDARFDVGLIEYKQNLINLRKALRADQVVVWMTPTVARGLETPGYAKMMRDVAAEYGDVVADAAIIKDWDKELPDGTHPRQLGYTELVDLCLAPAVNNAIVKFLQKKFLTDTNSPDDYYRKDLQQKFVMNGDKEIQLGFTNKSASWIEVYHRNNISYRAVSRGLLDSKGILTSGVWNADNSQKLVETGRSYNLVKIKRDRGDIIFNNNYDIYGNPAEAKRLANDLNRTNDDNIIVITTYDEPKTNRLSEELKEAMYRCGASEEIFGSSNFKYRSSYVLVGIPGVGKGNGYEAYAGLIDATAANIAPPPQLKALPTPNSYSTMSGNPYWSNLLNTYGIWEKEYNADLKSVPSTMDCTITGGGGTTTINGDGVLNTGFVIPIARLQVNNFNDIIDVCESPVLVDNVNTFVVDTPDCGDLGMQFGVQGRSYLKARNTSKLQLTKDVTKPFTIEATVWTIPNGNGGMIINKDAEYEIHIAPTGNVWVALDWGVGTDVSLPGGGWYVTNAQIPFGVKTHLSWVVDGTTFYIYVDGVLKHTQKDLNRVNSPSNSDVFIGNRQSLGDQFTGYIIDLIIWDSALSDVQLKTTKDYVEYTKVSFDIGIAPTLLNFIPKNGNRPSKDLLIIGREVTQNDLNRYGIYKTRVDVLTGEPGDKVEWTCDYTANDIFKIGYWLWDVRKFPTPSSFNELYSETAGTRTKTGINDSFIIPSSFTTKSIIVFGVGDWDPQPPTGFSDVSLSVSATADVVDWSGKKYSWDVFFSMPDEYTFEMSSDNIGYIEVQSNLILSSNLANAYTTVTSVDNACAGYKESIKGKHTIPGCGWYTVTVYSENKKDLLVPPKLYDSIDILPNGASLLLDQYAVWDVTKLFTWDFTVEDGVVYTAELSSIGPALMIMTMTGGSNLVGLDLKATNPNINGFATPVTARFNPPGGSYTITISAAESVPISAVAAKITDDNGRIVWNTRSVANVKETDYKGVAARILDRFNKTIWTTRSISNQKERNSFYRERIYDKSNAYSEIEFEISPQGTIIPVDIHPPRYEYLNANSEITSMKSTRSYDIVSSIPPVNGTRIVNHQYYSRRVATHPERYQLIPGNKIRFDQPMYGVITVVSDTVVGKTGQTIAPVLLENVHSMDYYRERFNPTRWAPGANVYPLSTSVFGAAPGSNDKVVAAGNTAPRVVKSAVNTNTILAADNIYNTGLNFRVGDSHYAEPVVLTQPLHGYARLSIDRKSINYTPFYDFKGYDSFSYTLITQHGQEGIPKNVYIRIESPAPTKKLVLTPTKTLYSEIDPYFQWNLSVFQSQTYNVKFVVAGGTTTIGADYKPTITYKTTGNASFQTYSTGSTVTISSDIVLRLGPIINDPIPEPQESVIFEVRDAGTNAILANSTVYLRD